MYTLTQNELLFLLLQSDWSPASWWYVAGLPAALYTTQTYCSLIGYQNLSAVTFNVLNQTKTLSAALCCYFVLGRVQSGPQIVALLLLLLAALVLEKVVPLTPFRWITLGRSQGTVIWSINDRTTTTSTSGNNDSNGDDGDGIDVVGSKAHFLSGVLPVLVASFVSGLAGALTQKSLQGKWGRNSYLFTMELSVASMFVMFLTLLKSPDGKTIRKDGFWKGWTARTFIPVTTNAAGGVLVGLVTKHAGTVRKGFSLILGLFLSGVFQALSQGNDNSSSDGTTSNSASVVTKEQMVGGILAAVSLWMHSSYPAVQ